MNRVETKIDIAKQFSPYPAGRVSGDGPNNGQRFRDEILVPALKKALEENGTSKVVVDIDGCRSFGSSFLEEAFGGLMRLREFPAQEAIKRLSIQTTKPYLHIYRDAINSYIENSKNSTSN